MRPCRIGWKRLVAGPPFAASQRTSPKQGPWRNSNSGKQTTPDRHECHLGNKHTLVPNATQNRTVVIISATWYPDRPRANKTTASPDCRCRHRCTSDK